ncbi:uncharacterized protein BDR25DRAFT_382694 [Lindgomyces ingoldianus]|uniref:Uncharacterized protein n=1 Tax=Lindgomyces ingoldianus TaxID=673940 RepID=A0ACB6RAP3_9PLEO|nr:uncharacterized protein BDR25DRAFT_382694 [Lindgomyces ingoldianus]KAF2475602.1 hypothetical protein BDR25DRAFT_382694 [Lindgomyces ingoldianus]
MAPSTNADEAATVLSTALSTAHSDLETPTDLNPSDTSREVTVDTSSSVDYTGYEGINWSRLPGYHIRKHRRRPRTGWVWDYGYDIEKDGSGDRFWLCKKCHQKKATIIHGHIYHDKS